MIALDLTTNLRPLHCAHIEQIGGATVGYGHLPRTALDALLRRPRTAFVLTGEPAQGWEAEHYSTVEEARAVCQFRTSLLREVGRDDTGMSRLINALDALWATTPHS